MIRFGKNISVLLLVLLLVCVEHAYAGLDSCSVSVSSHTFGPDSTSSITINVQNQSDTDATSVDINRPGGDYHLSSSGVDGCGVDQGDDHVRVSGCNISPSGSLNIPIDVVTDGETGGESWSVNMNDDSGDSDIQCGGDLSAIIQSSSGGGSSSFSISGISASGSVSSATISWLTDASSTSIVEYGTSQSYGQSQSSSGFVTSHSVGISGLSSNTTYHFRVTSVDGSNNSVSSGDNTFTTSEEGVVTTLSTSTTSSSSRVTPTPTLPPDVAPPVIYVTTNLSKPVAKAPIINGRVTDDRSISKIEYSIDGGLNWFTTKFSKSSDQKTAYYSFTPSIKEDGNYVILVRGTDEAKNSANSQKYILIFDRIPPKIGGSIVTSGPQIISANSDGAISIPSHVRYAMLFSSVGGATDITIVATPSGATKGNPLVFSAHKNEFTSIWTTDIRFDNSGYYTISAEAIDGADNRTVTKFAPIHVLESGVVLFENKAISDAKINVYYYDTDKHSFLLWDGKAYAQNNPTITDKSGRYSFMLPKGKYYIEVKASGYKRLVSDIFSLTSTTALNSDFTLTKYPYVKFAFWQIPYPFVASITQEIKLKAEKILDEQVIRNEAIGKKIEKINLISDGEPITSEFFNGKKTILGFTNTWLPQSQLVIESLESENNYQTAIVIPNESDSSIQTFKKRGNYTIPFVSDKDGVFLEMLKINTLPVRVTIDEHGVVNDLKLGVSSIENN